MDNKPLKDPNPLPRLGHRYLEWTAYGLLILLAFILQTTPHLIPPIFGAKPLLMIPMTIAVAMFTGPVGGAAAGIACGLLWDLYSTRLLGFNALILLAVGCAAGLLIQLLIRNNLLSALLLILPSLLLQGLLDWAFNYVLLAKEGALFWLLRGILPNLLYTLAVSPLIYGAVLLAAKLLKRRE